MSDSEASSAVEFSLPEKLVADASAITSNEIKKLQVVNHALIDKLIQLEGELTRLREEREAGEGRPVSTSSTTVYVEESEEESCSPIPKPSRRRPVRGLRSIPPVASDPPPRIISNTPLALYSPYLPPIDRTKGGEDFYADLQDKRIIPGYDQGRFSCWCHVAKSAQDVSTNLSISHSDDKEGKVLPSSCYRTSRWFRHARGCDFYKDPWATYGPDGTGERMFPQFPLAKPVQPCEQEVDNVQAVSNQPVPVTMRSTQPSIPDVATSSGQANRSYISLPRYSPYLPPIDRTKTGQEFFAHLKDERIIAGYDEARFVCWCHVAKDAEKTGTVGVLHKTTDVHRPDGGRYRVSKFFQHASTCNFYKNPWATSGPNGTGERLYPQFPLNKPQSFVQDRPVRAIPPPVRASSPVGSPDEGERSLRKRKKVRYALML